MEAEFGLPLCGRHDCPVCVIARRLQDARARSWGGSTLFDDDTPGSDRCAVIISEVIGCTCQCRLKVDIDDADYRQTSRRSEITPMCDFVVVAALPDHYLAAAIEMKLGQAELRHDDPNESPPVRQLREGLRVLHEEFSKAGATSVPKAYLAVGKERDRRQHYLELSGVRLKHGRQQVPIRVIDCGSSIDLSSA